MRENNANRFLLRMANLLTVEPLNTVTNRPKKLAVFTGDRIILRGFFFYKKCMAFLPGGQKKKKKKKGKEKLNTSNANFLFFRCT